VFVSDNFADIGVVIGVVVGLAIFVVIVIVVVAVLVNCCAVKPNRYRT